MSVKGYYLRQFGFLGDAVNEELYNKTLELENTFRPAAVIAASGGYSNWRKASVTHSPELGGFAATLREKISGQLGDVLSFLDMPTFDVKRIQVQLTAHNDGDYFNEHTDGGSDERLNDRVLTFVYYFHGHPKSFDGGELVLLEKEEAALEPVNDSIVFFNSLYRHRVNTIVCPSQKFEDGRFTLNGWVLG
jgi:Rps23 Pro-64 3,4-dihydroxylase Tpa1-like proline 4-hydroxylase